MAVGDRRQMARISVWFRAVSPSNCADEVIGAIAVAQLITNTQSIQESWHLLVTGLGRTSQSSTIARSAWLRLYPATLPRGGASYPCRSISSPTDIRSGQADATPPPPESSRAAYNSPRVLCSL